jgi:hypothetical protein
LELANLENFHGIIVESDAKICFNALNGDPYNTNWSISSAISNILMASCSFASFTFVVHSLAKFVPTPKSSILSCNVSSLPKATYDALEARFTCCLLIMNTSFLATKKKKNYKYNSTLVPTLR